MSVLLVPFRGDVEKQFSIDEMVAVAGVHHEGLLEHADRIVLWIQEQLDAGDLRVTSEGHPTLSFQGGTLVRTSELIVSDLVVHGVLYRRLCVDFAVVA